MLLNIESGRPQRVGLHLSATELLGVGRFAEVYRAYDSSLQTDVAIKVYRASTQDAFDLAKAEQETLCRVGELRSDYFPTVRPHIKTRIQNANHPVLTMELGLYVGVDSRTRIVRLADVIPKANSPAGARLALALPEFWTDHTPLDWIVELFSAVVALHSKDIIHRDLKPSNILLKRAAGTSRIIPFVLDFNTSVRLDGAAPSGGTRSYLPPEVNSGKRTGPDKMDDLWAASRLAWELLHGEGASIQPGTDAQIDLGIAPPPALLAVLLRALSLDPGARFGNAEIMLDAIRAALALEPAETDAAPPISPTEMIWARERSHQLLNLALTDLAGENDLPVPKEVQAQVTALYSTFAESETQSINLEEDLLRIGTRAIPAVLFEAHRLEPSSADFALMVHALVALAKKDRALAGKAISSYAVSSNYAVRDMCWKLCRELEMFPEDRLDLLREDGGILLPAERINLADLCLLYSKDRAALLALTKYMYREYILDADQYRNLKAIAIRMGQVSFEEKARLIAEDAEQKVWEEVPEFESLPTDKQQSVSGGIIQLLGDAFGSMSGDALVVLRDGKSLSPRVFRTFASKLAENYPLARTWLEQEKAKGSQDAANAIAKLQPERRSPKDLRAEIDRYLADGDKRSKDSLRFDRHDGEVIINELRDTLRAKPSHDIEDRVLQLLVGFESRCRNAVISVAVEFWHTFATINYGALVQVATNYKVQSASLRNQVKNMLNHDLGNPHRESFARRGLQRLLGD